MPKEPRSLKYRTTIAFLWNFSEQLAKRGLGVGFTLLLAWYLAPSDYGLVSIVSFFIVLSGVLVDGGIKEALIRKELVTQEELNSGFILNVLLALAIYFLIFLISPYVAKILNEPALTVLLRVSALQVIFGSISVIQQVVLSRELKFKMQFRVGLPGTLVSGLLALYLASIGFGVWALILQSLVSVLVQTILYWSLNIWRPTRVFTYSSIKEIARFGVNLVLARVMNVPFNYMYVAVISKFYGTSSSGYYFYAERARDLLVDILLFSVQSVTFPALASTQSDDARLKDGYRKIMSLTAFVLCPIMMYLAVYAPVFFKLLLPSAWQNSASYLQVMCLAAVLYPYHTVNTSLLKVKGRSDLVLKATLYRNLISLAMLLFTFNFGIQVILIGQVASGLIAYLINGRYSVLLLGYSVREQLSDFCPPLLLSMSIYSAIYFWMNAYIENVYVDLFFFSSLSFVLYLAISSILRISGSRVLFDIVKSIIH
jgi:O-antigen/teichoic acid export membrane protein